MIPSASLASSLLSTGNSNNLNNLSNNRELYPPHSQVLQTSAMSEIDKANSLQMHNQAQNELKYQNLDENTNKITEIPTANKSIAPESPIPPPLTPTTSTTNPVHSNEKSSFWESSSSIYKVHSNYDFTHKSAYDQDNDDNQSQYSAMAGSIRVDGPSSRLMDLEQEMNAQNKQTDFMNNQEDIPDSFNADNSNNMNNSSIIHSDPNCHNMSLKNSSSKNSSKMSASPRHEPIINHKTEAISNPYDNLDRKSDTSDSMSGNFKVPTLNKLQALGTQNMGPNASTSATDIPGSSSSSSSSNNRLLQDYKTENDFNSDPHKIKPLEDKSNTDLIKKSIFSNKSSDRTNISMEAYFSLPERVRKWNFNYITLNELSCILKVTRTNAEYSQTTVAVVWKGSEFCLTWPEKHFLVT